MDTANEVGIEVSTRCRRDAPESCHRGPSPTDQQPASSDQQQLEVGDDAARGGHAWSKRLHPSAGRSLAHAGTRSPRAHTARRASAHPERSQRFALLALTAPPRWRFQLYHTLNIPWQQLRVSRREPAVPSAMHTERESRATFVSMRAHRSDLDDTLLCAERRVRAIKLRLQSLIADQLSLASSSAHSSPLSSTAASSDSASVSSNASQSPPHSSNSPALRPLTASPTSHPQTKPDGLTPYATSHTLCSPVTPPPAPPLPLPLASNTSVQAIPSQSSLIPPSPPTVKPAPQRAASSAPPLPRSKPPPPPPPPLPPPNLVQRVSSNRRAPPPPPSATRTTADAIEDEQRASSSSSPQSRIEKKLDALHAALTTALSLLQSQSTSVAITSGAATDAPTPLKKKPPPGHAVKVFDARQQMLEELKKKIGKRQKAAEEGAIANY